MLKKLKLWLFPTEVEGFKFDAVDRDGDGKIQEDTPFERKVTVVKKATAKKAPAKKAPVKKAPTKKAPAKKSPAKKTAPKKKK
jgi:topoisomerase IA-like protein